jgi:hypothetical protein
MAGHRTDLVRRSLFGSANKAEQSDTPSDRRAREQGPTGAAAPAGSRQDGGAMDDSPPGSDHGRRQVERTAITVRTDLLMRVKDAVAVLNGWPHQYTMARFVEEAFTAQLERLKTEHNGGREFPVTNRKIRTGRPPGT